jgi:NIMA (never in mitosis gene a)-related kinase
MFEQMNRSEPALHLNEINVNDKYKFLKQIGKGSYGEVWLVVPLRYSSSSIKSNTKQYVLKRLDLHQQSNETTQNDMDSAEREAKLLSALKHPNIVAYIESFRSNDNFLNIVMAYCEGGDLYTKLKERKVNKDLLPENQIVEWFVQICMALQVKDERNENKIKNFMLIFFCFSICMIKVFYIEI